ncbi:hypothetical protein [Nonomuraea jiangxiensis]|uniref:DUF4367 domain-containing protein n=1 Tax=Nonomuraea jiangxiensis TaxID=633440 RepID=A0A1G9TZQ3_9ACTN|nr:hypothetical protein [Nonomuraea jiangxiensis]SDM53229.1 hypothetical protein SAMN05421869_14660 [Nonomuraea jiangxiensis]
MNSPEPFDDLEAELLALGDLLDVPSPPPADVAAAVRARLESAPGESAPGAASPAEDVEGPESARRSRPRAPGRRDDSRRPVAGRGRRARWKVVTAVVIAVIAVTAATPQGRAAVAHILRLAGIEIQIGDSPPAPVTTTAPLPGERAISVEELPGAVKFAVRTPAELGAPRRVTVADRDRVVSMFWPGGIRLDQFQEMEPYFFKKLGPPMPAYTMVGPYQAWWVPGEHPLGYIRRQDGTEVPLRQAAPTLIWQQESVSYRLEGVRTMEEAVRIARSLR